MKYRPICLFRLLGGHNLDHRVIINEYVYIIRGNTPESSVTSQLQIGDSDSGEAGGFVLEAVPTA